MPPPDHRRARRAVFSLFISSSLFALMGAGTKLATRTFPGPQVALVRFLTGGAFTFVAVATRQAIIRPRRWGWLLARGFFGGSAVVAYFMSIQAVPVGVATLLNQTQPVYTMLFSWALLSERPRRGAVGAMVLTLTGVLVIVGFRRLQFEGSRGEWLGVFSAVTSGIAVTSIRAARRPVPDGHPPETAWSVFLSFTLLGALVTLPFVFGPFGSWVPPRRPADWMLLFGIGATSVGAQLILIDALGHLTATQSGVIAQLTVPLTILLGVLFLGERLTLGFVAGALLTLSGVLMAVVASGRGRDAPPALDRTL